MFLIKNMLCIYFSADHSFTNHGNGHVRLERATDIIAAPVKRHYPALPLERLPELLSRIDGYHQGRELTRLAVSLTLHVFIRSSELRFARWTEISFRNKIWTIPATREPIPGVRYSDFADRSQGQPQYR